VCYPYPTNTVSTRCETREEWQQSSTRPPSANVRWWLAMISANPRPPRDAERRGALTLDQPGGTRRGGARPIAEKILCRRIGATLELGLPVQDLVGLIISGGSTRPEGDFFRTAPCAGLRANSRPASFGTILAFVMTAGRAGSATVESPEIPRCYRPVRGRRTRSTVERRAPQPLDEGRAIWWNRSQNPGPNFKRVLDAAFEAQLDGAFCERRRRPGLAPVFSSTH